MHLRNLHTRVREASEMAQDIRQSRFSISLKTMSIEVVYFSVISPIHSICPRRPLRNGPKKTERTESILFTVSAVLAPERRAKKAMGMPVPPRMRHRRQSIRLANLPYGVAPRIKNVKGTERHESSWSMESCLVAHPVSVPTASRYPCNRGDRGAADVDLADG